MPTMRAVKTRAPNTYFVDPTAPIPDLEPDYLLVKVSHIALNPSDWKMTGGANPDAPHTVGCDMSGVIIAVGPAVTRPFHPGDRIAGLVYGQRPAHPESGAFAEYCLVREGLALRIPDSLPFAEAATLGVAVTTIGQGLYQSLGLPLPALSLPPPEPNTPIILSGAASAVGLLALQFARLSGFAPLATCSPPNHAKCAALGAVATVPYNDSAACAKALREAAEPYGGVRIAFDCVAEGESLRVCADALAPGEGGRYQALLPVEAADFPRKDVQVGWRAGYTAYGVEYGFPGSEIFQPVEEDYAYAKGFWEMVEGMVGKGLLQLGPVVIEREGGLEKVGEGLEELRAGKVRGGKLVYRVQDV